MGSVGKLDKNDAHVARHGQQHFAERLRLVFFAGVEFELFELGQTVHQLGHGRAKTLDQLGLGHAAVFYGVMQQRRHQGLGIELPFCALLRDGNRVGDVGLTTVAQLAQMGFIGITVGAADVVHVGSTHVIEFGCERGETGRSCIDSSRRRFGQ